MTKNIADAGSLELVKLKTQAPVVRKPISAHPRLNRPNPRNKILLRFNSVPRTQLALSKG